MVYTEAKRLEIVKVAKQVAGGQLSYRTSNSPYDPVLFERTKGYCARFIRQLFEAVMGLLSHSWEYRSESAVGMAKILYRDNKKVPVGSSVDLSDLKPGDLLFWPATSSCKWGHVAIYVGFSKTVENTSATSAYPAHGAIKFRDLTRDRLKTCSLVARVWG